jgi:hypothetical protein
MRGTSAESAHYARCEIHGYPCRNGSDRISSREASADPVMVSPSVIQMVRMAVRGFKNAYVVEFLNFRMRIVKRNEILA